MSTSDVESSTDLPSSSNSALPDQERHTERVVGRSGVREFLVVEHTANVRKNSKISAIWHHGGERRRLDDHSMERYWRCAYCKGSATILKITGGNVAKNDTHWNPINWWIDESKKGNFDTLHLYALDHLSCPAMATQCERVFSAARRTLTPERNALGMKVIEACECLRWWWRNGVVSGMPTVCPMTPRAVVEAQFITALVGDSASSDASEDGVD